MTKSTSSEAKVNSVWTG